MSSEAKTYGLRFVSLGGAYIVLVRFLLFRINYDTFKTLNNREIVVLRAKPDFGIFLS